jgi:hypothetical protein
VLSNQTRKSRRARQRQSTQSLVHMHFFLELLSAGGTEALSGRKWLSGSSFSVLYGCTTKITKSAALRVTAENYPKFRRDPENQLYAVRQLTMSNPSASTPSRGGLSLYANLLDPSNASGASISRAPVVFKQPTTEPIPEDDASAKKPQIDPGT